MTPTREQVEAYQGMFDHFNAALFGGTLPHVILNFSRKARSLGFFAPDRWERPNLRTMPRAVDGEVIGQANAHEISLNPDQLYVRNARAVASTLVHEMAHLWQQVHGKPSRRAYHNRQWGEKMKSIGLHPSDTAAPGGKEVGQRMSHYIIEGGGFDSAFEAMPATLTLPWRSGLPHDVETKPKKVDPSKVKHTCPDCGLNVWGKRGIRVLCQKCDVELEAEELPEDD